MKSILLKILLKVISPLTAVAMIITAVLATPIKDTDSAVLVSENKFYLAEALFNGQGVTNDGEYLYTSGCFVPLKIECVSKYNIKTMEKVAENYFVIPDELLALGSNHIGCISYYDGKIYVPIEDDPRLYPAIVVLDAETLECIDWYFLDVEHNSRNTPWCAVDENGNLYTSNFSDNNEIFIYNSADGTFIKELPITQTISNIQGGEIYDGYLYLSSNYGQNETAVRTVYKINLENGNVETAFTRDVGKSSNEAEGMTIYPAEDGSLFHVSDYDGLVGVSIRNYKLTGE